MFDKIKETLKRWSDEGIRFPYAYDKTTDKPSITLYFLYVTFTFMVGSIFALHFYSNIFMASCMTVIVWTLSYVFYRLRRLDKFKLDLDDKSIELDGGEDEQEETGSKSKVSERTDEDNS